MRLKIDYRSASRETYNKFCTAHPAVKISYTKFKEILYDFSIRLRDHILTTGEKVKIPFGMGELSVNKSKTRRLNKYNRIILPVDWVESKRLGYKVYNFNHHTEGYKFKWMWFRDKARFGHSNLWAFKPSRKTSRKLAEFLKTANSNYQFIYNEYKK